MKKLTSIFALALVCILSVALLCACAPNSDPDKAVASLKKNEYSAAKDTKLIPAALTVLGVKGVDCAVSGTKVVGEGENAKTEHVTIVYFLSADAANSAWETMQEYAQKEDSDSKDSDWTIAKSGKMIYWGTKAGIKAAK